MHWKCMGSKKLNIKTRCCKQVISAYWPRMQSFCQIDSTLEASLNVLQTPATEDKSLPSRNVNKNVSNSGGRSSMFAILTFVHGLSARGATCVGCNKGSNPHHGFITNIKWEMEWTRFLSTFCALFIRFGV